MSRAFVGLGANLGPARSTVRWALRELEGLGAVRASSLYRTEPLCDPPDPEQPWFVNAVAELTTDWPAPALLRALLELEAKAGRPARRRRWSPRVLDLDLLIYDDRVLRTSTLTLPHPDLVRRRFVLEPLAEIAPDLSVPRDGRTVRQLLAELDDPLRVERIPDGLPRRSPPASPAGEYVP